MARTDKVLIKHDVPNLNGYSNRFKKTGIRNGKAPLTGLVLAD